MIAISHPLRPYLPADAIELRELFAASIEELTQDDYSEDQRVAWASMAGDDEFAKRLGDMVTLVVMIDGDYAGFGSLKDNTHIDMLYTHPFFARERVATSIANALEKIAEARGTQAVSVDSSDTALPFFEQRGYVGTVRKVIPIDDQWLTNTAMTKQLEPVESQKMPKPP